MLHANQERIAVLRAVDMRVLLAKSSQLTSNGPTSGWWVAFRNWAPTPSCGLRSSPSRMLPGPTLQEDHPPHVGIALKPADCHSDRALGDVTRIMSRRLFVPGATAQTIDETVTGPSALISC